MTKGDESEEEEIKDQGSRGDKRRTIERRGDGRDGVGRGGEERSNGVER